MWRLRAPAVTWATLALWLGALSCKTGPDTAPVPSSSAAPAPSGLTPELAARVLARVGDHAITLGDYAAALGRMDRFERLRYQTDERRKQLLDELIDIELLSREAERRGLADAPQTKELVRQILRDEVLRELRDKQPPIEQIPQSEVRAYYDAHKADFADPERRRVSLVVTRDKKTAEKALADVKDGSPKAWGDAVQKYSEDRRPDAPADLSGDVGLVTAPSAGRPDNARVPAAVRAAAFEVASVPAIVPRVVEDSGKFYVVRVTAKNEARTRTAEDADRPIRVRLMQERLHLAEANLERELRAKFPVEIDEAALAKIVVPSPSATPPAAPPGKKP
ncbi:MAG TPA: peptidylprolyl isomerase [Polyangiaceae bacterium]|nr:peptidylprolyl isomerase [Polyangiaceae bacterium]